MLGESGFLTTALCVCKDVALDMRATRSWLCDRAWEPSPFRVVTPPRRCRGSGGSSLASARCSSAAAPPCRSAASGAALLGVARRPPRPFPRKDTHRGVGGGVLAAACRLRYPRAHSCQFACGARVRTGAAHLRVLVRGGALSLVGRLACGRLSSMGGR